MSSAKTKAVQIHEADDVAILLQEVKAGERVQPYKVHADRDIPPAHKIALCDIPADGPVRKYGQVIGFAREKILPGAHVHSHNLYLKSFARDYAIGVEAQTTQFVPEEQQAAFNGFLRQNGSVGTRNYIGIISSVSCSASVTRFVADALRPEEQALYPNVDGVLPLVHSLGCCMTPDGEGLQFLQKTLAGYADNPNIGAVLVIGLGCELNLVEDLCTAMNLFPGPRLKTLEIQDSGGTRKTVEAGLEILRTLLPLVNMDHRQPMSARHLTLGLECGGSDAYSGITANPALGAAVDILIRHGGTAILSETPEIFGAEHLLVRRAESEGVGRRLLDCFTWWQAYTEKNKAVIDNNPTPGNKAGGITSIVEKSLGAVSKSGTTNLRAVLGYADKVKESGLVFMNTPGYDLVSITGMIAGGANLVCFTTGRGTVCGFKPVPTLKLATNSDMFTHMQEDMDIDCGRILTGSETIQSMGQRIFEDLLEIASGRQTRSEAQNFGETEFVPWHIGAVM